MNSRMIRLATVLAPAALASACGTVVNLRNPETGATASCQTGCMSIASQQMKQALMTECVDSYTKQGYQVVAASR